MAETAQKTVEQSTSEPQQVVADFASRATVPPERMAWLVLVVAFVLFCVLSISSAVAVYAFLFRSSVAIPTVLHVGKGTVGLTGSDFVETVERELEDITNSATTISTDSLSQATIQFRDTPLLDVTTPPLLTSITLQSNTTVTFDRAARPRFDWSLAEQSIRLSRLAGSLDILVTNASDKPFLLSISTAQGIALEFHGSGRYRVSATVDEVRLHNLAGQASAYFTDEANSVTDVEPGNELVVRLGNRTFEHGPGAIDALAGSSFSLLSILGIQGEAQELPQGWDCFITQDNFPPGRVSYQAFDGRTGVRLRRLDNATSHGQVACNYLFEDAGLDVSQYDSIKVIATFYLKDQSLSQCGTEGSECPLMIRIDYQDSLPVSRHWIRGFHFDKEVDSDFYTRCGTCMQEHLIINKRVWYTFESENLLTLIDDVDRPERLTGIQFYASGHQFDTIVGEILVLLGDDRTVADPEVAQS